MPLSLEATILGVFAGKPEQRWEGKEPSAIGKLPVEGPQRLTFTGLTSDQQADLRVHGGPEKALHHYAADHMSHWQTRFPDKADLFRPGCFGENISTEGLHEDNLCLGDVLTMGTATVEICQGRQPCWKLNLHTGIAAMAPSFQKSGKTGWYYRVLEEGNVAAGDKVRLIQRDYPQWPLARLISARFNPALEPETAAELAGMKPLAESWRASFQRKTDRGYVENTDRRLKGV
ncbi:MOSC domain-containing protein [Roseibium suaedae]|uniref:MOSC domain-containing protein YiiM n=1 Tax=Roseibium suaedae TaxID=735517 RepID=A0A1M7HNY2_9HYPH|nr:MOSC domain-containing protein [Roseibium suaedae]SHM30261.1 MOSC domain-containing protein YiiM [Roseibium suaedae]